jgi:hypothetical protein
MSTNQAVVVDRQGAACRPRRAVVVDIDVEVDVGGNLDLKSLSTTCPEHGQVPRPSHRRRRGRFPVARRPSLTRATIVISAGVRACHDDAPLELSMSIIDTPSASTPR